MIDHSNDHGSCAEAHPKSLAGMKCLKNTLTPPSTVAPVVLHVCEANGTGANVEKSALDPLRFLETTGYQAAWIYLPSLWEMSGIAEHETAKWKNVKDLLTGDTDLQSQFYQICRRKRVAIWHGHDSTSRALGLFMRYFWPMRLVTTLDHSQVANDPLEPSKLDFDGLHLAGHDKIICASQDLFEAVCGGDLSADRCVLIERAVDTAKFLRFRDVNQAKRLLGIPPDRLVIGSVDDITDAGHLTHLRRLLELLLNKGVNVELLLLGDSRSRPKMETRFGRHEFGDRVHLLEHYADVRDIYQSMDVFLLRRFQSDLPPVLLQALALEVPIVAGRVANITRIITHGVNGLLCEPNSVDDMARCLEQLFEDDDLCSRLQETGRSLVERLHSLEVRLAKHRDVYDELMKCPAQGRQHERRDDHS